MWNTTEEEAERRRLLLKLAARGNAEARKQLEQEYHATVYTPAQIAKYVPQAPYDLLPGSIQRKLDALLQVPYEYEVS